MLEKIKSRIYAFQKANGRAAVKTRDPSVKGFEAIKSLSQRGFEGTYDGSYAFRKWFKMLYAFPSASYPNRKPSRE